jgi:hypothetical protein
MAKISVSIEDSDLAWLQRRAKRLHGGNLSAAIGDGVRQLRHHEAVTALLDRLHAPTLSSDEAKALGAELVGSRRSPRRRRRVA